MGNISVDHIIFARAPSLVSHFPTCPRLPVGFFFERAPNAWSMQNIAIRCDLWRRRPSSRCLRESNALKTARSFVSKHYYSSDWMTIFAISNSMRQFDLITERPFKIPRISRLILFIMSWIIQLSGPIYSASRGSSRTGINLKNCKLKLYRCEFPVTKFKTQRALENRVPRHPNVHISRRIADCAR